MKRLHFLPLESNPEVFNQLIHTLGISSNLEFTDVLSLDEPELLAFIPRPVLALVLVFPAGDASPAYEKHKAEEAARLKDYTGSGEGEDVVWYKQTIGNACGLYGILHAVSNGPAREHIKPDSTMSKLLNICTPLPPDQRALALEASPELEKAHAAAAVKGDSAVPASPEDEVDFHYICFVRSHKNGHLYEMDGDRKGPVDLGDLLGKDEDLLSDKALDVVRAYIQREDSGNLGFSLMALAPRWDYEA